MQPWPRPAALSPPLRATHPADWETAAFLPDFLLENPLLGRRDQLLPTPRFRITRTTGSVPESRQHTHEPSSKTSFRPSSRTASLTLYRQNSGGPDSTSQWTSPSHPASSGSSQAEGNRNQLGYIAPSI